jgi:hypothetical protein
MPLVEHGQSLLIALRQPQKQQKGWSRGNRFVLLSRFVAASLQYHICLSANIQTEKCLVGGPGVKPGFAASDAAVLFGYTTHPLELAPGIQPGSLR